MLLGTLGLERDNLEVSAEGSHSKPCPCPGEEGTSFPGQPPIFGIPLPAHLCRHAVPLGFPTHCCQLPLNSCHFAPLRGLFPNAGIKSSITSQSAAGMNTNCTNSIHQLPAVTPPARAGDLLSTPSAVHRTICCPLPLQVPNPSQSYC